MPLTVNEVRSSFSLSGSDVTPNHWAWDMAGPTRRKDYFQTLGQACYRRKIRELQAGVGVDGQKLKPVQPRSRPDRATGPPLSPHEASSRFQRYLRVFAAADRCTLYWAAGWSKVVRGHRVGWGHLPIRDVVGLTQRHYREAVFEAQATWTAPFGGSLQRT